MIDLDPKLLFIGVIICALAAGISSTAKGGVERLEVEICGAE